MVLFVLGLVAATLLYGSKSKGDEERARRSRSLGMYILALCLAYNAYYFLPSNFRWDTSLPLHVCDLLGLVAAFALIKSTRTARALLYFCALGLASQAIITPTGNQDVATARFWLYWLLHGGILSASLYDILVRKFRPTATDLRLALALDALYVVVIVPLDLLTGWTNSF
jgi:hypothetical integral membrane protein (TIGR02206 family)